MQRVNTYTYFPQYIYSCFIKHPFFFLFNASSFHIQTPLHLAILFDRPQIVSLLLQLGADTSVPDMVRFLSIAGYSWFHLRINHL